MAVKTAAPIVPAPPRLRPTWTTWMWLGFAVAVAVATVVGLKLAGKPFW